VKVFAGATEERQYIFEGIPVHRGNLQDLKQALESYDPDVLAVHAPTRLFHIPLTEDTPYPKVAWIHGSEALNPLFHHYYAFPVTHDVRGLLHDLRGQLEVLRQRVALRNFLTRCAAIVFVSRWMKSTAEQFLLHSYPHGYVIYNPVDTELFSYSDTQGVSRAVSIRLLEMKYGLDIAIRAYSRFHESSLSIYGKGTLEPYLKAMIQRYASNTKLTVEDFEHSEMPSILKQYDLFVSPSRTEAQGVTMCEAMSCGLPVVASNVGGVPEIVRHKVDGWLYTPNTHINLRRAVQSIISRRTEFAQMSQNARERVEALCSAGKIIAHELEILNSAAFGNL